MIVNLNEHVKLKEFAEVSVSGLEGADTNCRMELTFSKEALVGFATNLIWTYEDIDKNKRFHIHIDPLGGNPSGNQSMGFFLTSQSPALVIQFNSISDRQTSTDGTNAYKEIYIHKANTSKLEIKEPACDESIEEYELGLRNIANIKLISDNNIDITKNCPQVVLKLNYEGLRDLASMLLVLANNFEQNCEYLLAHSKQDELQYNMGVIFTASSCEVSLRCGELGTVYDYEPKFGIF